METHNNGRSIKSAEHQNDPAILFEVSDRFNAAPDQIEICDGCGTEDSKGIEALGREIEVSSRIERSRRYKEDVLSQNEFRQTFVDVGVNSAQNYSSDPRLTRADFRDQFGARDGDLFSARQVFQSEGVSLYFILADDEDVRRRGFSRGLEGLLQAKAVVA